MRRAMAPSPCALLPDEEGLARDGECALPVDIGRLRRLYLVLDGSVTDPAGARQEADEGDVALRCP